jgi:drug/metabolite transporter (DMT)-like permease
VLLVGFGVFFAMALILWTEGTRRIPAAEAAFLGTAEVPLAPLFAWLILAELPPVATLLGGALVLAAVFAHAAHDLVKAA